MGHGAFCDRCNRARRDMVTVSWPNGSLDMCKRCLSKLQDWVRAQSAAAQRQADGEKRVVGRAFKSIRKHDWLRLAIEVCTRDGAVTPDTLAAHASTRRDNAQWQLNYMARMGQLDRDRQRGRYVMPRAVQGAAE